MRTKGEGTVSYDKTAQKWLAKVPIGQLPSGQTKYIKRTASTKSDAQLLRRELLNLRDSSEPKFSTKTTFQEFALLHMNGEARNEIRENTRRGYLYLLESLVFPFCGGKLLTDMKSQEISAFLVALRKTHSASQVNHVRAAMSRVFQAALIHDVVGDNPMRRTKKFRKLEGDLVLTQKPWNLNECRQALDASIGTPMETFVHLAVLTGMRLGEMLGLQWRDVDFVNKTLTVKRTLIELRGSRSVHGEKSSPTFNPPKTAQSVRTLQLSGVLLPILVRHEERQRAVLASEGIVCTDDSCVFSSAAGTPVWPSNFSAKFRRFLKINDLRHVNIHSIRHAFAQNALELGIDLASISRALGHASLQITLDVYARDSSNLQDAATEGLAKWFEHQ